MKLQIASPYRNIDAFAITNNLFLLQDGFMDEAGNIHKRPGFELFFDLSIIDQKYSNMPIDGMYWFSEQNCLIVVCDTDIIKITDQYGTYSVIGSNLLYAATRCTFTKTTDSANSLAVTLFIANGKCAYTTGNIAYQFTGTNIPTGITHLASNNTYLATNDLSSKTVWKTSDVGTPFTWSGTTYSAQTKTDNIQGLYDNKGKIWVFGKDSIEPFVDAGNIVPFVRIDGGIVESGCVNPYAIVQSNGNVYFFNSNRDICVIRGGNYYAEVLSIQYSNRIQTLSSVNDVEVDILDGIQGRKFILFNFNDAHITIVYDIILNCFYEWGYWDTEVSQYEQFRGRFSVYSTDWNMHIIGDRSNGKIYKVSTEYTSDNGNPIRTEIVTGNYDFGDITQDKMMKSLYLNIHRGDGDTASPYSIPKAYIQIRDDYNLSWGIQREIDLGAKGQTMLTDSHVSGGIFKTRQFRILHMDNSKFILNGVYIDV